MYKYNENIALNVDTVLRRNRSLEGHSMAEMRVQFKIDNKNDYKIIKKWFKKNEPFQGSLIKDGICCSNPSCEVSSYELLYYFFTPLYEYGLKNEVFKCLDEIFEN